MSFDENVSRVARRLHERTDTTLPSESLRTRIIGEIGAAEMPHLSNRILPVPLSGIALASLAVATGSFVVIRSYTAISRSQNKIAPPAAAASSVLRYADLPRPDSRIVLTPEQASLLRQVKTAVDRTNSWHIIGTSDTNSVHGKTVEIWCRQHPFFFRKQTGSELIIDDGVTRTDVFPLSSSTPETLPRDASLPSSGFVTLRPSVGERSLIKDDKLWLAPPMTPEKSMAQRFSYLPTPTVTLKPDSVFNGKPAQQLTYASNETLTTNNPANPTGQSTTADFLVDAATHLPLKYSVVTRTRYAQTAKQSVGDRYDGEQTITAEYDVNIPDSVQKIALTPQFQVVDLRGLKLGEASTKATAATLNITLRPSDVKQDAEGNVQVLCDLYHDGRPYTGRAFTGLAYTGRSIPVAEDENNSVYLSTDASYLTATNQIRMYLVPQTPYASGASRPTHMTLHYPVTPGIDTYSDRNDPGTPSLPVQWLTTTVPLPAQPAALPEPSEKARPKDYNPVISADIARAQYYNGGALYGKHLAAKSGNQTPPPVNAASDRDLASYWWNAAATEADRMGNRGAARNYRFHAQQASKGAPPSRH